MRSIALSALFVLAFAAIPALASNGPASGTWKVSGDVAGNPVDMTCTVEQAETKLSGSCKFSDGVESAVTGEVNDKNVKWNMKRDFNGSEITLTFTGALDEESASVKGTINVQPYGVDGVFTAKKNAAEEKADPSE